MDKIALPIKTKIAAWWMIGISGMAIGIGGVSLLASYLWPQLLHTEIPSLFFATLYNPLGILIFIISGFLLLKRKKLGWWSTTVILSLSLLLLSLFVFSTSRPPFGATPAAAGFLSVFILLYSIIFPVFPHSFILFNAYPEIWPLRGILILLSLIPLILLLLDRKNFWKITL